jgi:hypothetical protein
MSQQNNNFQENIKIKINYEEDMYNFNENKNKNEVDKNKKQHLLNNTSIKILYEEYQY